MADFGVLNAVRHVLAEDASVKTAGAAENIHLAIPPRIELPSILIELEEVWTTMGVRGKGATARLRIKTSIISKAPSAMESMRLSNRVRDIIDGKVLLLAEGRLGVFKMTENIIDMPAANKPRNVRQFYDVLVRG